MGIFQLGGVPSTYEDDFVRHAIPEKTNRNKRTILRLKECAHKRSTVLEPPKPTLYWTTPSYGQIQDADKPDFTAYIKEPKEIIGCLPKPNLEIPKDNIKDMATWHEEVIKSRPRVLCVPNQIAADDGTEEERNMHAYHVYYREHLPGHTVGNSVFHPDLDIKIPKESFKSPEFVKPGEVYAPVKASLKKCFARIDADKERWLEFSDPNYNRKEGRTQEENQLNLDQGWVNDLEKYHTYNVARKKYRNYALGYTGHISPTSLPVKSERHTTLDPMLSFYEAVDSRKDIQTVRTDPGIKKKYEDLPLDKLRVIYGVNYVPTSANYSKDINCVPYNEYRKK